MSNLKLLAYSLTNSSQSSETTERLKILKSAAAYLLSTNYFQTHRKSDKKAQTITQVTISNREIHGLIAHTHTRARADMRYYTPRQNKIFKHAVKKMAASHEVTLLCIHH